jgi:hypothetical protein
MNGPSLFALKGSNLAGTMLIRRKLDRTIEHALADR